MFYWFDFAKPLIMLFIMIITFYHFYDKIPVICYLFIKGFAYVNKYQGCPILIFQCFSHNREGTKCTPV